MKLTSKTIRTGLASVLATPLLALGVSSGPAAAVDCSFSIERRFATDTAVTKSFDSDCDVLGVRVRYELYPTHGGSYNSAWRTTTGTYVSKTQHSMIGSDHYGTI